MLLAPQRIQYSTESNKSKQKSLKCKLKNLLNNFMGVLCELGEDYKDVLYFTLLLKR